MTKQTIEKEITAMLKENTGIAMMDSGGLYGRHWEKNQKVEDFSQQPVIEVSYWKNEDVNITLNIYHLLTQTLEITEESKKLDKAFKRFAAKKEYQESYDIEIIEEFGEKYLQPRGYKMGKLDNSYNYDSMLSQVYQAAFIYTDDENNADCILLQIHGGCDVRGGYTAPRIFAFNDFDRFMMAQQDLTANCKCTQMYSDDQGYHWYVDSQPEQTELDKLLGIETRDTDFKEYKFPKYWQIQSEENRILCKCCNNEVKISSGLGVAE